MIDRPIFIIGMERSGTSLLYSMLANHPDLYWFSRLDSKAFRWLVAATMTRRLAGWFSSGGYIATAGTVSRSSGLIPPSECVPYWRHLFGWGDENDYGIADDRADESSVNREMLAWLIRDLNLRLRWSGKLRLLFKHPGLTLRLPFLDAVFPNARFVHVVRRPADNLASIVKAKKESDQRFWGTKIPGWEMLLEHGPAEQGARQIAAVLGQLKADIGARPKLRESCLSVKYEDILRESSTCVADIMRFCELGPSEEVEKVLSGVRQPVRAVAALPESLSPAAREQLCQVARDYGYEPG